MSICKRKGREDRQEETIEEVTKGHFPKAKKGFIKIKNINGKSEKRHLDGR